MSIRSSLLSAMLSHPSGRLVQHTLRSPDSFSISYSHLLCLKGIQYTRRCGKYWQLGHPNTRAEHSSPQLARTESTPHINRNRLANYFLSQALSLYRLWCTAHHIIIILYTTPGRLSGNNSKYMPRLRTTRRAHEKRYPRDVPFVRSPHSLLSTEANKHPRNSKEDDYIEFAITQI